MYTYSTALNSSRRREREREGGREGGRKRRPLVFVASQRPYMETPAQPSALIYGYGEWQQRERHVREYSTQNSGISEVSDDYVPLSWLARSSLAVTRRLWIMRCRVLLLRWRRRRRRLVALHNSHGY